MGSLLVALALLASSPPVDVALIPIADLKSRAESGDPQAMAELGARHLSGVRGAGREAWPERRQYLIQYVRDTVGERRMEMFFELVHSDSPQKDLAVKFNLTEGRISQILTRIDELLSRRLKRPVSCRDHAREIRSELRRPRDPERTC